ncbi:MAG: hypothetical protein NC930_02210 [Candidatus Omnitrophica bacterium]|nr:hypothetical protein [Candidatus Omnitrophota bacterium]
MSESQNTLNLEEIVIAVYSALDDALRHANIPCQSGKLIPRPGPPPEVDDREVLCLAVLQELFGFESDHFFYQWLENNPTMIALFPRRLSRPNWADRRALLVPLIQRLSGAFLELDGEANPPFPSSIPIPSMSVDPYGQARRNGLTESPAKVTAPL